MKLLNERQIQEAKLIKNSQFLTIKQLSQFLHVSEMTIRRDMQLLGENNLVSQVYGGVVPVSGAEQNDTTYIADEEQQKNKALKLLIAQKAATLIRQNDVVFFDSGSTVQLLAEQLPNDFSCTAISSSFNALSILTKLPNSTVITPGGVFRINRKSFTTKNRSKRYSATARTSPLSERRATNLKWDRHAHTSKTRRSSTRSSNRAKKKCFLLIRRNSAW